MNLKMQIQYDGTRYDGWQRQGNTANTIQGRLEAVLERIFGTYLEIHGAGRTDAGVHAAGQVANVHIPDELARVKWHGDTKSFEEALLMEMNRYLPEDIGITDIEAAAERFHSRLNAAGKVYCYRIGLPGRKNVFERRQIYPLDTGLDLEVMRRTADYLVGEHDFRGFCSGRNKKKSTVRRLDRIEIREADGELRILYQGNGFLYNMVRILTGTLIEAGQGRRSPESVLEILETGKRELAGYTVPARGLTLMRVLYH